MFGPKKNKERERFYLLPGMGGRAYRRKQAVILKAAIIVGVLVGGLFAFIMWWVHRSPK